MTKDSMWHSTLEDLLLRCYKTEVVGEYLYYNRGLLNLRTDEGKDFNFYDFSDSIIKLVEDSKEHRLMLEEAFNKIDLPLVRYITNEKENVYNLYFAEMEIYNEGIFINLLRNENMMVDLYKEMRKKLPQKEFGKIWNGSDPSMFLKTLDSLIESEEDHQDIIADMFGYDEFTGLVGAFKADSVEDVMEEIKATKAKLEDSILNGIRDIVVFETDSNEIVEGVKKEIERSNGVDIKKSSKFNGRHVVELDILPS